MAEEATVDACGESEPIARGRLALTTLQPADRSEGLHMTAHAEQASYDLTIIRVIQYCLIVTS
jgi:hypothetical protein